MKSVYITSRGGTHPIHEAYAKSIGADFQFIDFRLPWHATKSSRIKRYLSWIVCALTFPNRKEYDLFLVSGQQVMPVLMRLFGRLNSKQKIVCFHANEGLYFTKTKKYGKVNRSLMRFILPRYHAHICVGKMQENLLTAITNGKAQNVHTIENGIPSQKKDILNTVKSDLETKNILFVGNLYAGWRSWYKGIDLMINAILYLNDDSIVFRIVGSYTKEFQSYYEELVPIEHRDKILLCGPADNLNEEFRNSSLYLHCSRGDAFPTTTLEALAAGIPCIVTEDTGTSHLISKISPDLVTKIDVADIARSINYYFNLNSKVKRKISSMGKSLMEEYILEDRIEKFRVVCDEINKK